MATTKKEWIEVQKNTPPADRTELNVYQKLVLVRESLETFSKDADTSSESNKKGYKYVSGAQVLGKIKAKMDEYGLILRPELSKDYTLETFEFKDRYGNVKDKYYYTGLMTYTFINADDPEDRDEVQWFLTAIQDDPSKAFGSALTYAERYFLLKYFAVPTDDDDPDKEMNEDKRTGKAKVNNIRQQAAERKQQKEAAKQQQTKQTDLGREIVALWELTGKNKDIWAEAMKTCGLKSKDEITENHLFKLEATINELSDSSGTGAE